MITIIKRWVFGEMKKSNWTICPAEIYFLSAWGEQNMNQKQVFVYLPWDRCGEIWKRYSGRNTKLLLTVAEGGWEGGGVGWHGCCSTSACWRSRSTEDLLVSRGELEHRCCQVLWGAGVKQVSRLPLTSSLSAGALFHYQAPAATYALSFADARRACQQSGAEMASAAQLIAAHHSGYSSCSAGWLSDQTVRWGLC